MICIPEFNKNVELLEKVCAKFDLQPRGSAGEHSAAEGAKFDVSNKQRIGFSEVELVQKMIDGVSKVIELEEKLAAGATAADIEAILDGKAPVGYIKDTADFKYENYEACPEFTAEHKSLMSKTLTPALFDKLKGLKTAKGYTLSNCIQTGVKTPHLGVGITAGDEESWTLFKDIMYPIIKGWHGYDPEVDTHKVDLDPSKVVFTEEQVAKFDKYVASTRIRAARNVSGFGLPAGSTAEDRAGVEGVLTKAFGAFEGELGGKYYPLDGMNDTDRDFLLSNGFLFQIPKETNLLWHAGAARDWPKNRGIFHNDSHTALCWVNEEDHCRIISMEKTGNVKSVFARFCQISESLSKVATDNNSPAE